MYVIFRALGKQFRAEKGQTVRLPLMDAEPGSKVTFDEVLLSSDGETINAGTPLVKGAKVVADDPDALAERAAIADRDHRIAVQVGCDGIPALIVASGPIVVPAPISMRCSP